MDNKFFEQRGVNMTKVQNFPLGTQLGWFKEVLPSLCHTASGKNRLLSKHVHKCMHFSSTSNFCQLTQVI